MSGGEGERESQRETVEGGEREEEVSERVSEREGERQRERVTEMLLIIMCVYYHTLFRNMKKEIEMAERGELDSKLLYLLDERSVMLNYSLVCIYW